MEYKILLHRTLLAVICMVLFPIPCTPSERVSIDVVFFISKLPQEYVVVFVGVVVCLDLVLYIMKSTLVTCML